MVYVPDWPATMLVTQRHLSSDHKHPQLYSRDMLSSTGTTGSVVKMRLPASTSTANPVNFPSPGAVQRTVPTKSVVSVAVNAESSTQLVLW